MKLKRSLQHVTTCKSDAQKKKNGNALVHNFVALSACATLAMILAVGTKVAEFGPRSQVYAASDKENRSADAWTDLGSVEYDLPTGIAGMVTSVADTPSAGESSQRSRHQQARHQCRGGHRFCAFLPQGWQHRIHSCPELSAYP
mgnify:CR=1 FL=1